MLYLLPSLHIQSHKSGGKTCLPPQGEVLGIDFEIAFFHHDIFIYSARAQKGPQDMERN